MERLGDLASLCDESGDEFEYDENSENDEKGGGGGADLGRGKRLARILADTVGEEEEEEEEGIKGGSISVSSGSCPESLPSGGVTTTKTTSRVSFSGDDAIREIPRIGTWKVPPRPATSSRPAKLGPLTSTTTHAATKSVAAVVLGGDDDPAVAVAQSSQAIPFGNDVIRMVVKERIYDDDDSTRINVSVVDAAQGGSGDGRGDGRRRLSRFAQQRLQREST
ncbi:hypothetical protein ACHAXA_009457 [Cyclostephanos tholiformis]|uniref:Uncharacterized protein n=1 Tax=Cyclostephanos tholiformis TaxID=382380 RepID=A0ABD3RB92_9STRA